MLDVLVRRPLLAVWLAIGIMFGLVGLGLGVAVLLAEVLDWVSAAVVVALGAPALGVAVGLAPVLDRIATREAELRDAELSKKYGRTIKQLQTDAWSIDGVVFAGSLVHATQTLLIGGRELSVS